LVLSVQTVCDDAGAAARHASRMARLFMGLSERKAKVEA
jgi:hypothetical protein